MRKVNEDTGQAAQSKIPLPIAMYKLTNRFKQIDFGKNTNSV